jgi:lipopolysaccharide export system ATP-binding protein
MVVKNMLEFDSLYLEFGHHRVLQDVYVKCETGEVVGIIGRNGSGKSCLMKIVFGSMKAYMQSVRINGEYVTGSNIRKGLINYLPQESFYSSIFNH